MLSNNDSHKTYEFSGEYLELIFLLLMTFFLNFALFTKMLRAPEKSSELESTNKPLTLCSINELTPNVFRRQY